MKAINSLVLSVPDPTCSEDAVIAEAADLARRTRGRYSNEGMHELFEAFERFQASWDGVRRARDVAPGRADEWALVADLRRRADGLATADTRATAVEHYLSIGRPSRSWPAHLRMARVGADAFGVQFLVDSVLAIYASGWDDEVLTQSADALGARRTGVPGRHHRPRRLGRDRAPGTRRDRALLNLAGHPEITAVTLVRLPQHRLDADDVEVLKRLVADRADVFAERFAEGIEQARSVAGELALMRALDAAGVHRNHGR